MAALFCAIKGEVIFACIHRMLVRAFPLRIWPPVPRSGTSRLAWRSSTSASRRRTGDSGGEMVPIVEELARQAAALERLERTGTLEGSDEDEAMLGSNGAGGVEDVEQAAAAGGSLDSNRERDRAQRRTWGVGRARRGRTAAMSSEDPAWRDEAGVELADLSSPSPPQQPPQQAEQAEQQPEAEAQSDHEPEATQAATQAEAAPDTQPTKQPETQANQQPTMLPEGSGAHPPEAPPPAESSPGGHAHAANIASDDRDDDATVVDSTEATVADEPAVEAAAPAPAPGPPAVADNAEAHGQRDVPDGFCVVCLEKKANITLIHGLTGHTCVCHTCAENLVRAQRQSATSASAPVCPICREPVEQLVRVFGA